ncbi:MAG: tRNA (guanosine(37)-N1)-methyltransferase TrmD [Phototrophicales bacterium]|nr:MAG: tRNA (guanosine(37)-N1)-methyltransferase TrmD [Phototrophicales bacterium]
MRFDVLTLFPKMFEGPTTESILKRAQAANLIEIHLHNIRDYAFDKHHITDDTPAGGGGGMVMKVEPIVLAVEALNLPPKTPVILTTPQGRVFNQKVARELAQHERIAIICGRYEGVDERVRELVVTDEISIGDYVLTGGELAAMVIIDAVSRLVPGVLGARWAAEEDSHAMGLLEYPQYTRPAEFRGLKIPEVLTSGNHQAVEVWRRRESLRRTWEKRPDMLQTAQLTDEDRAFLETLKTKTDQSH